VTAILSLERFVPPYRYPQEVVTDWVRRWLAESGDPASSRWLSVYAQAGVHTRAAVVPIEDVFSAADFETQNDRYAEIARSAGIELARRALASAGLRPQEVDLVVSVSCTGFMIPAVEAYVADALDMGPRLVRIPLTESGCAGGVVAIARAADYLTAHPEGAALILALEFSSLTFQRWDHSPTNVVSTAIFGDGGAALVAVGPKHPRWAGPVLARVRDTESLFFPRTTHLMGFRLRNEGLQIILDRSLAPFLRREVKGAVEGFLGRRGLSRQDVTQWVLHPGGRRIVEAMAEALDLGDDQLAPTEAVLSQHGNLSSATVLFVLDEVIRRTRPSPGERGVLGAFGPGFGAEFALLEFDGSAGGPG
jgi:alkylresorcinol/alkylpyrone synthase